MTILAVKHNIETAHRLSLLPGKCENIHGHSMWVTLRLEGDIDKNGLVDGVDFGSLKRSFRQYLDNTYDHRLLLNVRDPLADALRDLQVGTVFFDGDPSTENIARWIYHHMKTAEGYDNVLSVEVWETAVNMAEYLG